jgi:hypothetical protein
MLGLCKIEKKIHSVCLNIFIFMIQILMTSVNLIALLPYVIVVMVRYGVPNQAQNIVSGVKKVNMQFNYYVLNVMCEIESLISNYKHFNYIFTLILNSRYVTSFIHFSTFF